MDALSLEAPGRLTLSAAEMERDPGPGEILVQVERVSLCGTDYRLFAGQYKGVAAYPVRFGHEWSGRVVAVGPDVRTLSVDDPVTGDCSCWCGRCANCARDRNLCQRVEKYGITRDGFSQRYKVMPAKYAYAASPRIPHRVLALAEPFAVALHAIRRLGDRQADRASSRALILGCGPLGAAVALLLGRHYGWPAPEVYDVVPERVTRLQRLLPDARLADLPQEPSAAGQGGYAELYGSPGYAAVFVATGDPAAVRQAIDLAEPGGTVVCLGIPPASEVDLGRMVMKAVSLVGSIGGTGEFPIVLQFFEAHADLVSQLVTAVYPHTRAADAFLAGQDSRHHLKVQISFGARGGNGVD